MRNTTPNISRSNRRTFLQRAAGTVTAATASSSSLRGGEAAASDDQSGNRAEQCFRLRLEAAKADGDAPAAAARTNGDESRYPNRIGNFSKGLPHNSVGEVDPAAYQSLLNAVSSGDPRSFDAIAMGGNVPLVNPQAGLAFDMEGLDSHAFALGTPPAVASAQRAGEMVELYWMALLRDVSFADFAFNPGAVNAAAELSKVSDFRGPKENGKVTARTLFRGFTSGDVVGPYVSQFLLKPLDYGAIHFEQKIQTYPALSMGGKDYLTTPSSWLAVQNGAGPFGSNLIDPLPRYVRSGRDLAAYVHIDVLFEAYFNACLWLLDNHAPLNPGNPYAGSRNQAGFGTFGGPHVKTLVAEAATRALKAVWYQKWFVHRTLRPEAYGGLVHFTKVKTASYPLHTDVLNSEALAQVFSRNSSFFLPHAFPEGCPQHPSYGQGHSTVAGACATMVKAFFDDSARLADFTDIVQGSADGFSLVSYTGSDRSNITVGGEMNKLAANVGIGRNHAGVHWRSDYTDSLALGEAVAISILRDQRDTYNESFAGFTFTKFDGTKITV